MSFLPAFVVDRRITEVGTGICLCVKWPNGRRWYYGDWNVRV